MQRPKPIEWPNKRQDLRDVHRAVGGVAGKFRHPQFPSALSHRAPPANAVFSKNMAAVTEREYGDRVGIWRLLDLFDRHDLKVRC